MIYGSIPYGAKESIKNPNPRKGFLDESPCTRPIAVGKTPIQCAALASKCFLVQNVSAERNFPDAGLEQHACADQQ